MATWSEEICGGCVSAAVLHWNTIVAKSRLNNHCTDQPRRPDNPTGHRIGHTYTPYHKRGMDPFGGRLVVWRRLQSGFWLDRILPPTVRCELQTSPLLLAVTDMCWRYMLAQSFRSLRQQCQASQMA